ncbi:hypothetical protein [Curtobacterium citreum]|uniref:hypothetical protein n=1 Tax=Curtobacterium citreum TaxID=2036 RepID=UPI0025436B3F|nr:hypothetical protein [Curtobacterium citreum]WIJ46866.1 hypothetical protein QPK07_07860 [Curtobacterium citreum]
MQIKEALLPTRSTSTVAAFFDRLGCVVTRDGSSTTVRIGLSRVRFVERDFDGSHHLAFTIPTGTFDRAQEWLEQRTPLLSVDDRSEFEGPESWNSCSMYFDGPDGQVLELIERRALPATHVGSFTAHDLECVSEIGVAVPDVLAAVATLRAAGIRPYGNEPTGDFAAVGDIDGLLILVTPGRAWFPTTSRYVADTPVTVITSAERELTLGGGKSLQPATANPAERAPTD